MKNLRIGFVCYPTFGGSGVVATELGKALAEKGHELHFITYSAPARMGSLKKNLYYHEVRVSDYPLFDYCLLYTSPSPRDGLLSRMPSSA